jgi:DNA-directed RNA polymerase specialized sigma24 family protein
MRRASSRLAQKTLEPEAAEELLASVPAREGSREAIEQAVLWREALDRLTPDERLVCRLKIEGYSSEYIARIRRSSTAAVDMVFSRAKQKLHRVLADAQSASSQQKPAAGEHVTPRPSPLHAAVVKKPDGERTPGA